MSTQIRGVGVLVSSIGIGFVAGVVPAALIIGVAGLFASQGAAILGGLAELATLIAFVAGGWAGLILHARGHRHWLLLAAVAVVLESALFWLDLLAQVSILVTWAAMLALLCAAVAAASLIPAGQRPRRHPWWHVPAALAWPPAVLAGAYTVLVLSSMAFERLR
jgi:hypothetical protein